MMQCFEIKKTTPLKPQDKHWQFCVGSGHAALALRADYRDLLTQVHRELGIRQVRFHGIFCDDMHTMHTLQDGFPLPAGGDIVETSFRQCAAVYDNILASGMKPFVELSFMPTLLAKDSSKGGFFYRPNLNMPADEDRWVAYIQTFIHFLMDRYDREEVESWYFEVWNEPDLKVAFFNGSQQDYFHLYEITAKAIKDVNQNLKVGGPSTSGSKWVSAFVRFCKENDVPVDFVTTHQYAGDPLGGVHDSGGPEETEEPQMDMEEIKARMNPEHIRQAFAGLPKNAILPALRRFLGDPLETTEVPDNLFRMNAPVVKQQAQGLPVYYTEWNTCATFAAYSNDTRKVAAYNAKTALALDGVIDGSSIWCFSDIFEEMHPFPEEFHGGFGMLTQSGIKKPVYHAMQMLADSGELRYELPGALDREISCAAFRSHKETQILLIRQKMKNLFELPKAPVRVCVETEIKPARVYVQRIDEDHCNPLNEWENMGSPQVPNFRQLQQLTEATAMRNEEWDYTYENGVLIVQAELGVNDVYFIRICWEDT